MSNTVDDLEFDDFIDEEELVKIAGECSSPTFSDSEPNNRQTTSDKHGSIHKNTETDEFADDVAETLMQALPEPSPSPVRNLKRSFSDCVSPSCKEDGPPRKKPALETQDDGGATTASHDQPYRITFGKQNGKTLDEVPSAYIDWLVDNEVYQRRPDLALALRRKGLLGGVDWSSDVHSHINPKLSTWVKPHADEAYNAGFYDEWEEKRRWIALRHARKYFGVDAKLLQITRILNFGGYSSRYWLYLVYSCAEHFGTVPSGTTRQALLDFPSDMDRRGRAQVSPMFSCDCC